MNSILDLYSFAALIQEGINPFNMWYTLLLLPPYPLPPCPLYPSPPIHPSHRVRPLEASEGEQINQGVVVEDLVLRKGNYSGRPTDVAENSNQVSRDTETTQLPLKSES